jgi:queuine tRNA-ribosyltransferase
MHAVLELLDGILPAERPRYLMGVGTPGDLVNGVLRGVDMFDCVLPTRLARHNAALTSTERLNLLNAGYANDPRPIDEACACYTCAHFSRAYLRHLIVAKEMLSATLLSIHNLHALISLMAEIRQAIMAGHFNQLAAEFISHPTGI